MEVERVHVIQMVQRQQATLMLERAGVRLVRVLAHAHGLCGAVAELPILHGCSTFVLSLPLSISG
jgi:hypothetical protein